MEQHARKNIIKNAVFGLSAITLACTSAMAVAGKPGGEDKSYTLQGACAFLPADRATEFHGNADNADLRLGMAGNQWVVFDKALQQFNIYIGERDVTDPLEPDHRDNPGWNLADLNQDGNRIYTQLIPPGQIRKQIKSGCMILANDEERNFLPTSVQVDFDVFASTNYNLMQDIANAGFIDEAVPYISNKLDLMVVSENATTGKHIGTDSPTGDAEFDKQFDIVMDLLSGDIVANKLDHINEGIHNAANGYMNKVSDYIRDNDPGVDIYMDYTLADGTPLSGSYTATEWLQMALKNVATPQTGSPGELRATDCTDMIGSPDCIDGDAGENHTIAQHGLEARGCVYAGDTQFSPDPAYKFCEYALLNKANTHESRVHHVEVPNGLVDADGYEHVDVGFVWITELGYQVVNGNTAVTGMNGSTIGSLGIPNTNGVNGDKTYSLALLATSQHQEKGRQFINFLRDTAGQTVYTDGGFTGLDSMGLAGGKCYSDPRLNGGVSIATNRADQPGGKCPDWLGNGSF
ncbi:MAG: hypothetical protein PVG89_02730 [Gammaproteobacteria bacterium]|jgi:hypothetical protein